MATPFKFVISNGTGVAITYMTFFPAVITWWNDDWTRQLGPDEIPQTGDQLPNGATYTWTGMYDGPTETMWVQYGLGGGNWTKIGVEYREHFWHEYVEPGNKARADLQFIKMPETEDTYLDLACTIEST